jgi:hypothetical protein
MSTSISIDVPDALAASYSKHSGASGRAWIAALNHLRSEGAFLGGRVVRTRPCFYLAR